VIPESFHFLRPAWLWALLMLGVIAWSWRRRSRSAGAWERVCDPHLLAQLATRDARGAGGLPLALLALGWTAACLALAGPTWERLPQTSFREPARSVFVLTLGDSMNQRDVRPSRLARARHKLLDALDRTAGGSVALVAVREEAFAVTPLTDDVHVLREAIPLLETRLMPGRGVFPARGFEEARRLLEPVGLHGARIVLVSDGSDDDPAASEAAARALADDGAQVSVLALAGENEALADLARSGGGSQAALAIDDADLEQVLPGSAATSPLDGPSLVASEVKTEEWKDMGAWLAWIPLLLAPFAFRKGWAGALLALLALELAPAPAEAGVLDAFARPDQRGARAFADGRYPESAQAFEDPAWQAAARYRAGDFAGASQSLAGRTDPVSQYNLGNALAKSGQLEPALAAYESALAAAPADADAKFNRDLVKRLLEQQQQQQEQKQDQQQQEQQPSEQDSKQGAKSDQQDQGEGSQGSESPEGSQASASDRSEKAEDAGAEAEARQPASAADADSKAKAQDAAAAEAQAQAEAEAEAGAREPDAATGNAASGSPADSAPRAAQDAASADPGDAAAAPGEPGTPAPGAAHAAAAQEQEHAQWMARLPDDPGGLLREKIRRDYLRKQALRQGETQP
jgi:Ca-activated chloride channel family protein